MKKYTRTITVTTVKRQTRVTRTEPVPGHPADASEASAEVVLPAEAALPPAVEDTPPEAKVGEGVEDSK